MCVCAFIYIYISYIYIYTYCFESLVCVILHLDICMHNCFHVLDFLHFAVKVVWAPRIRRRSVHLEKGGAVSTSILGFRV